MEQVWQILGAALIAVLNSIILAAIFWKPLAARIVDSHEFKFEWGKPSIATIGCRTSIT